MYNSIVWTQFMSCLLWGPLATVGIYCRHICKNKLIRLIGLGFYTGSHSTFNPIRYCCKINTKSREWLNKTVLLLIFNILVHGLHPAPFVVQRTSDQRRAEMPAGFLFWNVFPLRPPFYGDVRWFKSTNWHHGVQKSLDLKNVLTDETARSVNR